MNQEKWEKLQKDGENFLKFFTEKIQMTEKPKKYKCQNCGKGLDEDKQFCEYNCLKNFYKKFS